MWRLIVPVLILTGCSSTRPPSHPLSSTNHPLMSMAVDCRYGARMVNELEYIIQNPHFVNPIWQSTFATLSGNTTEQQRTKSAKTVLWTIRTQCQGF